MLFTADQVEEIVEKLITLKQSHTPEQINQLDEFTAFRTQNRMFYEMILSPEGLNKPIFQEMMKMKRRLEAGEDQYSVDVRFGQFMAKKYIDPVTKKIT
jgi:hypothetical protein